jgi:hypothetical protein
MYFKINILDQNQLGKWGFQRLDGRHATECASDRMATGTGITYLTQGELSTCEKWVQAVHTPL